MYISLDLLLKGESNMKKLHVYTVYMDDGDAFRVTVPAESEAAAREYVAGNGDVIAVKDAPLAGHRHRMPGRHPPPERMGPDGN